MDLRNLLGKLDQINEGTMSSAKKKPTGPKFVGKMKGTDPASAAKDKYVGGSMEESIFKELEETLQKQPARDLKREFAEFKFGSLDEAISIDRSKKYGYPNDAATQKHRLDTAKALLSDPKTDPDSRKQAAAIVARYEMVKENPVAPADPVDPAAQQPGEPTLGTDLTKPAGQQDAQQQQDLKAQQAAAQKEKQEQTSLMKGVNDLKAAGAAVSNTNQIVNALDKAEDNKPLTPGDKSGIASAGTVLAPIMANPQLQGKFKDLVTQASAAQKKEQQQQANQPAPATTPGQTK